MVHRTEKPFTHSITSLLSMDASGEQPVWKRCLGWGLRRAMELPCPFPNPLSYRFHGGSPTRPCFGDFSGVSLQRCCNSVLGHWSLNSISSPFPSPGSGVGTGPGLEGPNLWSVVASPDTQPLFCGALYSHIINVIKWMEWNESL